MRPIPPTGTGNIQTYRFVNDENLTMYRCGPFAELLRPEWRVDNVCVFAGGEREHKPVLEVRLYDSAVGREPETL